MTSPSSDVTGSIGSREKSPFAVLVVLAVLLWAALLAAAVLSRQFSYGAPVAERPIWSALGLFAVATLLYLAALPFSLRVRRPKELVATIWFFAIALRLAFVFTEPILEIDLYRYLWDGNVVAAGVSPYRYTPLEIVTTERTSDQSADMARLTELRNNSPALDTIVARIHFSELPSPYPPVSQAVFALAAVTTPSESNIGVHLAVLKAWLLVFDLATIAGVLGILRIAGMHSGWAVTYAWCPLVIKEFANSGHLDAIAVCLTTLAVFAALRLHRSDLTRTARAWRWAVTAWTLLALGVGAKLYPLVLAPMLAVWTVRQCGWRVATAGLAFFLLIATTAVLPLAMPVPTTDDPSERVRTRDSAPAGLPPLPSDLNADSTGSAELSHGSLAESQQSESGLAAFLTRWRMNDFLFHFVEANLTPTQDIGSAPAWFAVTPDSWRRAVCRPVSEMLSVDGETAAFLVARCLTVLPFGVLVVAWAWRLYSQPTPHRFGEYCFLTLAWFWLLAPTQNPWYWTWAIPLLPFARGRAWFALSGTVMIYYLRFWCDIYWLDRPAPFGTEDGRQFFDHVVTWIEYAPWFLWLLGEWIFRRARRADSSE